MTRRLTAHIVLAACLSVLLAGCAAIPPAANVANQSHIDRLNRMVQLRQAYASGENVVTGMYRAGAIDRPTFARIVNDLQYIVRPMLDAAQAASVAGDFDLAVAKAQSALAAALAPAQGATTKPSTGATP